MVRRFGLAGLGLIACAAACGPDASKDAFLRTSHACLPGVCLDAARPPMTGDSGLGNTPLEPWPDANAGPVSGIYATLAVVQAKVAVYPVTLRLLFRLRILQTASSTRQSTTLCAFKLPSAPGIATLVIPPLLQTVIQENSVAVAEGDYISSSGQYTPPPFLLVLGAKLKNPATDPLPCIAGDPGCAVTDLANEWDEDHDGHPGVTVDATVVTCPAGVAQGLYVALRTGGTLSGTVSGDAIDGTMHLFETESVLGYSNSCLSVASSINPQLNPDSQFHAQRVATEAELDATGNVTCDAILADAPTLFGSQWM